MSKPASISWPRAISWGAYLASSWTWCIGMFLPILMVRDFGQAGWWAFAIPNVVGAAAMGWVLRSSLAASRLRAGHLGAGRTFSLVTIAFHVFFLSWMTGNLIPMERAPGVIVSVFIFGAMMIAFREQIAWVAMLLWLGSASVLLRLLLAEPAAIQTELARPGVLPASDILWMSPVCAFGFALCPYLDLSFLRARRVCDGPTGVAAFTIGFGIMFASMIVLTLGYASMLDPAIASLAFDARPRWAQLAVTHIMVQAAFTIAVHVIELATPEPTPRDADATNPTATPAAASPLSPSVPTSDPASAPAHQPRFARTILLSSVLLAAGLGIAVKLLPDLAGLSAGEIGYRCFMSFYGLVFPTYVWVCVVPRSTPVDRRTALTACLAGVAFAMPFFAAGFLWRETIWLAPGLLIAISSRWWPVLLAGKVRKPT